MNATPDPLADAALAAELEDEFARWLATGPALDPRATFAAGFRSGARMASKVMLRELRTRFPADFGMGPEPEG